MASQISALCWSDPQEIASFTERGYRDKRITSMKRKRYTTEQIIAILRQPDTGKTVQEVCRGNNLSEQTFYRWRKKYGNLELSDVKRFKELEKDNTELKKMRLREGCARCGGLVLISASVVQPSATDPSRPVRRLSNWPSGL